MALLGFYFLTFLALFFALMVVLSRNPVYSVIFLVLTFFAIAGHYLLLNAQFLAMVHVIVYAGAIMVLFLYVIMMLNLNQVAEPQKNLISKLGAAVSAGLLLLVVVAAIRASSMSPGAPGIGGVNGITADPTLGTVQRLGQVLFTDFLLPFELTSLLFLLAMVGAVLIGKKDTDSSTVHASNTLDLPQAKPTEAK